MMGMSNLFFVRYNTGKNFEGMIIWISGAMFELLIIGRGIIICAEPVGFS